MGEGRIVVPPTATFPSVGLRLASEQLLLHSIVVRVYLHLPYTRHAQMLPPLCKGMQTELPHQKV